jgi:hypothetical protein
MVIQKKDWYDVDEVVDLSPYSKNTINQYLSNGIIKQTKKFGRTNLIHKSEIDFLNNKYEKKKSKRALKSTLKIKKKNKKTKHI